MTEAHSRRTTVPYAGWEDWLHLARCKDDPDLFFPEPTSGDRQELAQGGFTFTERRAKAICAACPVRVQCLTRMYLSGEREGIWGGTTQRERKWHQHAPGCHGCSRRTVVHVDYVKDDNARGGLREMKVWRVYGCKPVEDRVRDLLVEMDDQAVRNGFQPKEGAA